MPVAAPIIRLLAKLATGKPAVISGKTASKLDEHLLTKIGAWIRGETEERPTINLLYRGVYSTIKNPAVKEEGYTHITPWANVAARGGERRIWKC